MNTPIRVLHVLTTMNQGGAETMVMNYYRHIDTEKVQFDFLLHREEIGAYEGEILSRGGRIHRLPALTLRSAWRYPKWIYDFLSAHTEYQCIHIHSSGVAYFVARAAHQLKCKVIIQHSHACARNVIDWTTPIRYFCKIATRKHLTHFFSCGKEAAEWLFGQAGARKAIILPNAINTEKFRYTAKQQQDLKRSLGWHGKYTIGNVARFYPQKNHFQMLAIFKATLSIKPNARLILVGKKEGYYPELRKRAQELGIENSIEFTGARSDINDLLKAFDIFLFPSLFEGLSVAMIEAQAAGLKIIASNNIAKEVAICPGLVEFLPLDCSAEQWAARLVAPYNRTDTYETILKAGYDIKANAQWLQQFYLENTGIYV